MKKDGTLYRTLPQPLNTSKKPPIPDSRFPTDLPVAPYDIALYVPPQQKIGDTVNRALQEKRQINGGRMDGFVAWSENCGLAMSYYDATDCPLVAWLSSTTLSPSDKQFDKFMLQLGKLVPIERSAKKAGC